MPPYELPGMTKDQITAITLERLGEWGRECVEQHSTPAVLISIGHDEDAGDVHVFSPDECSREYVDDLLRALVRRIESGSAEHAANK